MQHGGPVPVAGVWRKLFIRPRDSGGGGPPCEAGWWRGRRTRRAARVLMISGHIRSFRLAKRIFCNENEAWSPAPPPPRFARYASSSGPPPPLSRGRMVRAIPFSQRDPRRSFIQGEVRIGKVRFANPHSPLAFVFPQKEEGRRNAGKRWSPPPHLAMRHAPCRARSPVGVPPRLSPKGIIPSQRLGFRPGFLGRGLNGRYPPSPVPVQGSTSHPGHNAGRLIPKPPGSGLQIRPRAPHPLHLTACLRKASLVSGIFAK